MLSKTFPKLIDYFRFLVGIVLHPTDHQEFYDWQNLAMVATMAENQTESAQRKVCRNQGNFALCIMYALA